MKDCNLPEDLSLAFIRINKELNLNIKKDYERFIDLAVIETHLHLKYKCPHCKVKD